MRWDDRLEDLFADAEQQAEGRAMLERDAEVAELGRAEYAAVDLAARLHASLGRDLVVAVTGVGALEAVVRRVGSGWLLLASPTQEWVVRLAAVEALRGLDDRATAPQARPVTAGLGLASALRGVAETRGEVVLHRLGGSATRGRLGRVGADFVEIRVGEQRQLEPAERGSSYVEVVPFESVALVRSV